MDGFPDPLLFEILQRLPLKSIFRFKSVSKHWLSIISDPFFIHSYTHLINIKNNNPPPWAMLSSLEQTGLQERALIRHPDSSFTAFSLQFLAPAVDSVQQPEASIKLLASSNGLLLLCALYNSQILHYYVCNPSTMRWVRLPKPPSQPKWVKDGFLVEQDSGHYLVARVPDLLFRSRVFNIELFSSESGEWRCLKVYCPRRIRFFVKRRQTVSYQGIIHWLVDYDTILAFDPKNNTSECRLIDLPSDRESDYVGAIGVSCGLMFYMDVTSIYVEEFRHQILGVWRVKDYDAGEWCLEYRIDLNECWSSQDELISFPGLFTRPLAFHPLNPDVVYLDRSTSKQLISCNLSTMLLEVVDCESYLKESLYTFEIFPFELPTWPTPIPKPSWEAI